MSLARGRFLHRGGESAYAYVLFGVPNVVLVFEDLLRHGWIEDMTGNGQCYRLSRSGLDALRDGVGWYRSLPLWRRLLRPRFGLSDLVPTAA